MILTLQTRIVRQAPLDTSAGLTLMELIVVMAIIAILAGVTLPTLASRVDSKTEDETAERMEAVAEAIRGFAGDMLRVPTTLDELRSGSGGGSSGGAGGSSGSGGGSNPGGGNGNGNGNGGQQPGQGHHQGGGNSGQGGGNSGGGGGGGSGGGSGGGGRGSGGGGNAGPGPTTWRGPYIVDHMRGSVAEIPEFTKDNWGRDYSWTTSGVEGTLRSAGRDGQMNTSDDLTLTVDIRPILREITLQRMRILNVAIANYNQRYPNQQLSGNITSVLNQLRNRGFISSDQYLDADAFGASWILNGNPVVSVTSPNANF